MKTLAIVSSYNELCGNANYTHALKREFEKHVAVEVLPLKTQLLAHTHPALVRVGDRHIEELAQRLPAFDYINIQFEAGLYGGAVPTVFRRVRRLIQAAPNLIVTLHRSDVNLRSPLQSFLGHLAQHRWLEALRAWRTQHSFGSLTAQILQLLRQQSRHKNAWALVHTRRDSERLRLLFGFEQVADHPLAYLSPQEQEQYRTQADPAAFKARYHLPADAQAIGVFGFISPHKGYETAIEALRHLPENFHLLIFGGQHPLSIKEDCPIDANLQRLLSHVLSPDPAQSLCRRVHFLGSIDDESFLQALYCCNRVVLPYLEVGQGMSAIAALALETRAPALFARNLAVLELARYAPEALVTFDIGNHLELAEKLLYYQPAPAAALDAYLSRYTVAANIRLHLELFEGMHPGTRVAAPRHRL